MKFYIYTLGCKVNTYESNIMKDVLVNKGYQIGDINNSDIYIINTCTVTNEADNKSMKTIRQAIRKNKIVVVAGCLTQHDYQKVTALNGVNIIIGNINKSKIDQYIEEYLKINKQIIDIRNILDTPFECMKLNNFDYTRAFVKIEDGCENYCAYCIIPYTRGKVRSKDPNEVISEIEQLVSKGHKEIVLTGIHTGHYGSDIDTSFATLLKRIIKIKGLIRLRISSIEITEINDEVINIIKENHVIANHLHIPLQSGCDKILKSMNRKYNMEYFFNKVEQLRKIRNDISITTDVIVGFPNETDQDFKETMENIRKLNFSKIHVFPYSERKGTPAATMENQITSETKKARTHELISLSEKLEKEYMKKFLKQTIKIIPETIKNDYLYGHSSNYLSIKLLGESKDINKEIDVFIEELDYPYLIGSKR